ncbi:MAG TPA: hypothetical protein ENI87_09055 [bacterium]|nr:hypothetical protein [bacterium]
MSTPPTDPVAEQLQAIRADLERMSAHLGELVAENRSLRAELAASQAARSDLVAQAEQLIHMLELSRKELRGLKDGG